MSIFSSACKDYSGVSSSSTHEEMRKTRCEGTVHDRALLTRKKSLCSKSCGT